MWKRPKLTCSLHWRNQAAELALSISDMLAAAFLAVTIAPLVQSSVVRPLLSAMTFRGSQVKRYSCMCRCQCVCVRLCIGICIYVYANVYVCVCSVWVCICMCMCIHFIIRSVRILPPGYIKPPEQLPSAKTLPFECPTEGCHRFFVSFKDVRQHCVSVYESCIPIPQSYAQQYMPILCELI